MRNEAAFFRENNWLYHFTKMDIAEVIIRDGQLKYGSLRRTNDACENAKCIYNEYVSQSEVDMCNDIESEIYRYRQMSLSRDMKVFGRRGFDLQQMWGLYAECGRGACLVFDKAEFIEHLPKACIHGPVSYNAEMTTDTFTSIQYEKNIEAYIRENAVDLFFNKRKEWEHEQEYRFIMRFDNTESDVYFDFKGSLKYVILYDSSSAADGNSTLGSCEYSRLAKLLPKDVNILVYSSFVNEQSLICYENESGGEILWNSSEKCTRISDIDV